MVLWDMLFNFLNYLGRCLFFFYNPNYYFLRFGVDFNILFKKLGYYKKKCGVVLTGLDDSGLILNR